MNESDRDSIVTRLWGYVAFIPSDVANLYSLQSTLPQEKMELWVSLLGDLVENRLDDPESQDRYLDLFPDPASARASMEALQDAWGRPRMALLREMIERDVRALQAAGDGSSLVPAESPRGTGLEGAPVDRERGTR